MSVAEKTIEGRIIFTRLNTLAAYYYHLCSSHELIPVAFPDSRVL